jgi:hypothetical protein
VKKKSYREKHKAAAQKTNTFSPMDGIVLPASPDMEYAFYAAAHTAASMPEPNAQYWMHMTCKVAEILYKECTPGITTELLAAQVLGSVHELLRAPPAVIHENFKPVIAAEIISTQNTMRRLAQGHGIDDDAAQREIYMKAGLTFKLGMLGQGIQQIEDNMRVLGPMAMDAPLENSLSLDGRPYMPTVRGALASMHAFHGNFTKALVGMTGYSKLDARFIAAYQSVEKKMGIKPVPTVPGAPKSTN